jgi:hypothetical protein
MDARLKLWLEAMAGMQGRFLLQAMIVAARSWTDGRDVWQRANCQVEDGTAAQRRLTSKHKQRSLRPSAK